MDPLKLTRNVTKEREYKLCSINPLLREVHHAKCIGLYQAMMTAADNYLEGWSVFIFESGKEWRSKPVASVGFNDNSIAFMEIRDDIINGELSWESWPKNPFLKLLKHTQKEW